MFKLEPDTSDESVKKSRRECALGRGSSIWGGRSGEEGVRCL